MSDEIKIPLQFQSGIYTLSELSVESHSVLILRLESCNILSYAVPGKGNVVRLYSLDKQDVLSHLTATYRDSGVLYCVELRDGEDVLLVYLHCLDANDAKAEILDFAEQSAEQIAEVLLKSHEKAFRLFIEHFYDGESFDFAAKIATEADWQTVLDNAVERAGDRANDPRFAQMLMNHSGNYPHKNRVPCDTHTIRIMLQCAPCDLYEFVVRKMTERIKERVIPQLNKTDDFQFVVSEYD